MSKEPDRYGPRYGFNIQNEKQFEPVIKDGIKYINNKAIKKLRMSIPTLGFEKTFLSVKDCAKTLGMKESTVYIYARTGYAACGILKFEYVKEEK